MKRTLFAVAAVMATLSSANAQNTSATATFATVRLSSGFTSDPYTVGVTAGGETNASGLGGGCVGQIATPPDIELNYSAGTILPLYISVSSDADTSLVINMPNGNWVCDDDSGDGLDPAVYFDPPQSGVYDIWIGVVGGGNYQSATVYISELGPYGQ
jgi:hypothetical protein